MRTLSFLFAVLILVTAGSVRAQKDDARSVIEKAIVAHGGDKLETSASVFMRIKAKLDVLPGESSMEGETWAQGSGSQKTVFRMTVNDTKVNFTQVLHNGKAWRE